MIKRKIIFSVLLAAILVFSVSGVSFAMGVEAAIGVWAQNPSGDFSYKSSLSSDRLDLEDNLGFSSENQLMGRVKIDMPSMIPNVYIMGTPMSFDGSGSKAGNFTFGDKSFNVTSAFSSKLELNQYDIALFYSLPFVQTATLDKLNVELGLNAKIIDLSAEITGTDTVTGLVVTQSKSVTIPVPMVYVGIQLKPTEKCALEGELRGIAYGSSHYYDLIGRVKYRPFGPLFVAAGYRYEDIQIDTEDIKSTLKFSGPFAEAGVIF